MNKIYTTLSILSLLFVMGCNEFLDQQSPDELNSATFWRNKDDAESAMAATYALLEASTDIWEFAEIKWPVEAYREDICKMGSDALNYQNWVELYTFNYTPGNSQFTAYWKLNYRGASNANQVISKLKQIPDAGISAADRTLLEAEARFLRAYFHMKVILNWNKIIIRDKYIVNQNELNKAVSDRTIAWEFIIADLKWAADFLPAQQTNEKMGRATSGAANSYLGFAYLTRAYEETANKNAHLSEALKAFDKVKGYDLEKNLISLFDGTNKNSKEAIFELQFSAITANGASYRTALHRWIAVGELKGWDEIQPSEMLMHTFMKEGKIATTGAYDSRLYQTVFFKDVYFNDPNNPRVYGRIYDSVFKNIDKPAFRKYLQPTWEELSTSRTSVNVPLMRYANVLLMQAEVLNELQRTPEAIPLINRVRNRADMPNMQGNTYEQVKAQIEHERIIEFPLENFRFYDLRRWGKTKTALHAIGRSNFDPDQHNFYPVPQTEIDNN